MAEKVLNAVVQEGVSTLSVDDPVQAKRMSGISRGQVSRLCDEIDNKVKRDPCAVTGLRRDCNLEATPDART